MIWIPQDYPVYILLVLVVSRRVWRIFHIAAPEKGGVKRAGWGIAVVILCSVGLQAVVPARGYHDKVAGDPNETDGGCCHVRYAFLEDWPVGGNDSVGGKEIDLCKGGNQQHCQD